MPARHRFEAFEPGQHSVTPVPGAGLARPRHPHDPNRPRRPGLHLPHLDTGATVYGLLALTTDGDIAPHWTLGLLCGLGGLIGGYLGARLQPRLPERALRLLLGVLATALATLYLIQGLT